MPAWSPPAKYEPLPDLDEKLRHESPPVGSALFDMVVFRQWTHYWWKNKTDAQAWQDLHMSPANARKAIDTRIVPPEIYPLVLKRAQE
jgi:hypothetical protein